MKMNCDWTCCYLISPPFRIQHQFLFRFLHRNPFIVAWLAASSFSHWVSESFICNTRTFCFRALALSLLCESATNINICILCREERQRPSPRGKMQGRGSRLQSERSVVRSGAAGNRTGNREAERGKGRSRAVCLFLCTAAKQQQQFKTSPRPFWSIWSSICISHSWETVRDFYRQFYFFCVFFSLVLQTYFWAILYWICSFIIS